MRTRWLAAVAMAWIGSAWAAAPSEQQVRQLMTTIGLGHTLTQMNGQVADMMKRQLPCVPASAWQGYLDDNASDQLIGQLVPVFQKHFTAEDIDGLIKFYSSPLGQKVLTEMPQAMAEAQQVNQSWSRERMQALLGQLQKDGTLAANGQCPASAHPGKGLDEAATGEAAGAAAVGAASSVHKSGVSAHKASTHKTTRSTTHKTTSRKAASEKKAPAKTGSGKTTGSKTSSKSSTKAPVKKPAAKPAAKPASSSSAG